MSVFDPLGILEALKRSFTFFWAWKYIKTDFLRPQRFLNPGAADKPYKIHDFRTFIHFRIDTI